MDAPWDVCKFHILVNASDGLAPCGAGCQVVRGVYCSYRRGAPLLVLLVWAMREPQCVERQRVMFPRSFLYTCFCTLMCYCQYCGPMGSGRRQPCQMVRRQQFNLFMAQKICLSIYGELYRIDLEKVMYFQADDHYTHVYYTTGTHFLVPFGLSKVEMAVSGALPDDKYLMRLSRKYIINVRCIFHVNMLKQVVVLSDDHGTNHSIHLPRPTLRLLMQLLSEGRMASDAGQGAEPGEAS